MVLTPVGIVNERHEPPSFNGVERPFVETLIIPTTWRELGFGLTGDLGRGFRYRAYLTSSLDASLVRRGERHHGGRTSGFDASMRNPAKVGRLEYAGSAALGPGHEFLYRDTPDSTPGVNPRVDTIGEFDGRYRCQAFDFRGLFANTWVSSTGS